MRRTVFDETVTKKHEKQGAPVRRVHRVDNRPPAGAAPPANTWLQGLRDLRALVKEVAGRGARLRAQGGLWSLSDVAWLDDEVVAINALNQLDASLPATALHPAARADGRRYVFVQAGISVVDLHLALEKHGLALPTCGASNGQTLAGAIATGTHGAAIDVGSMQDYVAAIHLVGADGDAAWIHRATRPVVSDAFAQVSESRVIADDALFDAALVNVGCFGVVHAYLLEVWDRYLLELYVQRTSREKVLAAMVSGEFDPTPLGLPRGAERPHHVEFIVNPHASPTDLSGAVVRVMYRRPWASQPPAGGGQSSAFAADLIASVGKLVDVLATGCVLKMAVDLFLGQLVPDAKGMIGPPAVHFGDTSLQPGGISTELGIASTDVSTVIPLLCEVSQKHGYAGVLAMRFVRPSKATLAFTRHGPLTCTIETPCIANPGTRAAMQGFWHELTKAGIPYTTHWGQLFPTDSAWVKSTWGAVLPAWKAARAGWLTTPASRKMFSNDLTQRLGISD